MALAIDATTPAKVTGNAVTITSGSFSPPAGSFLLAEVARNVASSGANADGTVSSTGGLSWTLAGRKSKNAGSIGGAGTDGGAEQWWTYAASAPGSITVSDARGDAASGLSHEHILKVIVITGAESSWGGAINAASNASGLPSVNVTTTRAASWVFAVNSDWGQKGAGTVGTAQTMIDEDQVVGQYDAHIWRQTSTTPSSGTAVTSNLTAPSAQQYNVLAIEIREPAAATAAAPWRRRSVQNRR